MATPLRYDDLGTINAVKLLSKIDSYNGYIQLYTELDSHIEEGDMVFITYSGNTHDLDVYLDNYTYVCYSDNFIYDDYSKGYKVLYVDKNINTFVINRFIYTIPPKSSISGHYVCSVFSNEININKGIIDGTFFKDANISASTNSVEVNQCIMIKGNFSNVYIKSKYDNNYLTLSTKLINDVYTKYLNLNNNDYGYSYFYNSTNIKNCEISTGNFINCTISSTDSNTISGGYFSYCYIDKYIIYDGYFYNSVLNTNCVWKYGIWNGDIGNTFILDNWYDGIFINGIFGNGTDSRWNNGKFLNGIWRGNVWLNGKFSGGLFEGNGKNDSSTNKFIQSEWLNGQFTGGKLLNATGNTISWRNGEILGGEIYNLIVNGGTIYGGDFYNSSFKNATIDGGNFHTQYQKERFYDNCYSQSYKLAFALPGKTTNIKIGDLINIEQDTIPQPVNPQYDGDCYVADISTITIGYVNYIRIETAKTVYLNTPPNGGYITIKKPSFNYFNNCKINNGNFSGSWYYPILSSGLFSSCTYGLNEFSNTTINNGTFKYPVFYNYNNINNGDFENSFIYAPAYIKNGKFSGGLDNIVYTGNIITQPYTVKTFFLSDSYDGNRYESFKIDLSLFNDILNIVGVTCYTTSINFNLNNRTYAVKSISFLSQSNEAIIITDTISESAEIDCTQSVNSCTLIIDIVNSYDIERSNSIEPKKYNLSKASIRGKVLLDAITSASTELLYIEFDNGHIFGTGDYGKIVQLVGFNSQELYNKNVQIIDSNTYRDASSLDTNGIAQFIDPIGENYIIINTSTTYEKWFYGDAGMVRKSGYGNYTSGGTYQKVYNIQNGIFNNSRLVGNLINIYDGIFNNVNIKNGVSWWNGSFNGDYFKSDTGTTQNKWFNGKFYNGQFGTNLGFTYNTTLSIFNDNLYTGVTSTSPTSISTNSYYQLNGPLPYKITEIYPLIYLKSNMTPMINISGVTNTKAPLWTKSGLTNSYYDKTGSTGARNEDLYFVSPYELVFRVNFTIMLDQEVFIKYLDTILNDSNNLWYLDIITNIKNLVGTSTSQDTTEPFYKYKTLFDSESKFIRYEVINNDILILFEFKTIKDIYNYSTTEKDYFNVNYRNVWSVANTGYYVCPYPVADSSEDETSTSISKVGKYVMKTNPSTDIIKNWVYGTYPPLWYISGITTSVDNAPYINWEKMMIDNNVIQVTGITTTISTPSTNNGESFDASMKYDILNKDFARNIYENYRNCIENLYNQTMEYTPMKLTTNLGEWFNFHIGNTSDTVSNKNHKLDYSVSITGAPNFHDTVLFNNYHRYRRGSSSSYNASFSNKNYTNFTYLMFIDISEKTGNYKPYYKGYYTDEILQQFKDWNKNIQTSVLNFNLKAGLQLYCKNISLFKNNYIDNWRSGLFYGGNFNGIWEGGQWVNGVWNGWNAAYQIDTITVSTATTALEKPTHYDISSLEKENFDVNYDFLKKTKMYYEIAPWDDANKKKTEIVNKPLRKDDRRSM